MIKSILSRSNKINSNEIRDQIHFDFAFIYLRIYRNS